jgi:hypothetical protein
MEIPGDFRCQPQVNETPQRIAFAPFGSADELAIATALLDGNRIISELCPVAKRCNYMAHKHERQKR